jgi:hypothetical protein
MLSSCNGKNMQNVLPLQGPLPFFLPGGVDIREAEQAS